MKACLNMIVRNEGARIERALASAAPFITSWVIVDTGSTDDTKDRIIDFFTKAAIPGEIRDEPFVNFEQARNAALKHARDLAFAYQPDFYLLMDADMELVIERPDLWHGIEGGTSYELYQTSGAVTYTNTRLISAAAPGWYKGVTHEYVDIASSGIIPYNVGRFKDHADGSNRKDKYLRDIRLLKQGLKDEPKNPRYMYYLAASYRDAGKPVEAAKWFKRRVAAGGWDEEVWQAQLGYAHALKDSGNPDGFIRSLLDAYNLRPTRAETMYDMAKYLREKGSPAPALAAAEAVEHLPRPADKLFVNDWVYETGIKEEIAISAFYVPGKRDKGRIYNDRLSLAGNGLARYNTHPYVQTLTELCPSFTSRTIPFTPPDDLVPLNPSVTVHNGTIWCNVRAVNYRIDEDGAYIIKATDGTANRENPIDTRNFVLNLGVDAMRDAPLDAMECYRPGNMPANFPLVMGFEDMRLFSWHGHLHSSATVRQLETDGQCEQVMTRLIESDGEVPAIAPHGYVHWDMRRMLRTPRVTEKNWSPVNWPAAMEQMFVSRPGVVLNTRGEPVVTHPSPVQVDNLSGSSQLINWKGGWIAMIHSAHTLPGQDYKRYYTHRFIEYTADFKVKRITLPFVFHDKVIEFCAGMCWNISGSQLVISYGYKDCEARIGTVDDTDVDNLLKQGHNYDVT